MYELIKKGYARESTTAVEAGKCWYLPHHAVYHPNKLGKIRVVFDLSAEFHGTSINKALLSGPDLTISWGIAEVQRRANCSYW